MRFVSEEEWWATSQLSEHETSSHIVDTCIFSDGFAFSYENQNARELHIARIIVNWISPFDKCMLWIREYGVWPSHENWPLYKKLRQAYGATTKLSECPLHIFDATETDEMITFLELALRFGWGGEIKYFSRGENAKLQLKFDHHGWFYVGSEHSRLSKIVSDVQALNIDVSWKTSPHRVC